jgi:hypothetical protein
VFSSYNLTTKTAVLKKSELFDDNTLIFIHTVNLGNWMYMRGHLYGSPDNTPLPNIDWREVKNVLSQEDEPNIVEITIDKILQEMQG